MYVPYLTAKGPDDAPRRGCSYISHQPATSIACILARDILPARPLRSPERQPDFGQREHFKHGFCIPVKALSTVLPLSVLLRAIGVSSLEADRRALRLGQLDGRVLALPYPLALLHIHRETKKWLCHVRSLPIPSMELGSQIPAGRMGHQAA